MMGANLDPNTGRCEFRVWAPNAAGVSLVGPFNGWGAAPLALGREGASGNWVVTVPNVAAGAPYKFIAGYNDGIPTQTKNGNQVATCASIMAKLDYIQRLGFNAIALLPIGEFPAPPHQAHMGYAPTDWFAPESDVGTPSDVRALVDAAHARGLAVIFDVVYNHAATEGNQYWEYDGNTNDGGIYFESGGDSPFGRIPAHWKHEVRDFFLDNARMWLDEYRADGLRFDAAHLIQWQSLQHVVYHLRQNQYWQDKLLIAEWTGDDRGNWKNVINDAGFNSVWGMSGPYAFREAVKRGAFGGDAIDSMTSVMDLAPYRNHWNIVRYYLGSHDQIRDTKSGDEADHRYPVEKLGGRDDWFARAQCRMGWVLAVTAPGIPMLFMGCEGHLPGYWWPTLDANSQHGDHRMDWSKVGDPIGAPMQRLVQDANRMRWEHAALRSHSLDITHADRQNNVFAFRRWNDQGDVVLTVVNFSNGEWQDGGYAVRTGVGGSWQEIFNSQAPLYGGYENSGNGPDARWSDAGGYAHVCLPKWSVLCFRQVG